MSSERTQIEAAIQALQHQRTALGPVVVDAMLAGLHSKLAALDAAQRPPPQQAPALKLVSILFLDLVGSTTLSQHLDPEAIAAVMDDALARGTAVVDAHGGRVLQYAGDNILAAFGADEAREDDAERAVHCGLALLALGRVLGDEVLARHGHAGFNVRVGLHTGGVLLGGGVDADGSIRGIAVNIAARMEQTAPPGGLRISQATYALVRGLFEVQAQPPLAVKGVDTPVQSWLVQHAKPRAFHIGTRGIEGVATRMVGRAEELAALQQALHDLFEQRRMAAVTVVAEAGVGKSRLLHEFEAWSEAWPERFVLFRGRATPQTSAQAFGLLRDILAWRFQIADDDSVETARSKLVAGVVPLFAADDGADLAEGHAHLLGHLIGIDWRHSRHIEGILDDARQLRNRAFHTGAQLFRRLAAATGHPVVLQLEDLHWADDESLEFLHHLADVARDVPLLVLGFTRPTLFERPLSWQGPEGRHRRIDLQPLDSAHSRLLADELLQKLPAVPAALRELVTGRAEGNPFYMEELVKMLIDQGAIQTRSDTPDTWQVDAGRLLTTQVPTTLTGVLQARLDGLPAAERHALRQASIIGAVFWDQALAAVEAQAAAQLPALVQRELTLPRADSRADGLREYSFRHQLLHQVTYDTVLKPQKREGHARVALWLAGLTQHGGARAGDFPGLAALHFELAGDDARAAEFHALAAEQAGERLAHDRVVVHVTQALARLDTAQAQTPAQTELRWRLLRVRERALAMQAQRAEQGADLARMAQIADALDDDKRRTDVALRQATRSMRMADWPAVERAAHHAVTCASRAGDDSMRLAALRMLAMAAHGRGDTQSALALAVPSLAETRRLGLRALEARFINMLTAMNGQQGDLLARVHGHQQCVQIYREVGDRINEAVNLNNLAETWCRLGDLPQAQQQLEAALAMARANGDRVIEGCALTNLSTLALYQGHAAQALALAQSALAIAVDAQARDDEMLAGLRLGEAALALGQLAEARAAFLQAHALALTLDDPAQHDASAGLARVALATGDATTACAVLQPVLELLDQPEVDGLPEGTEFPRRVELTCHQALAAAGDARADAWLARAHSVLEVQAATLLDATLRHGFLHHIPEHRDIMAAWAARAA